MSIVTFPKGTYPPVDNLVRSALTAAAAPIEIHRYNASTLRSALRVVEAIAHDRDPVTFKQTAKPSGRPAGPLLITVRPEPDTTWQILIQPQDPTEGARS